MKIDYIEGVTIVKDGKEEHRYWITIGDLFYKLLADSSEVLNYKSIRPQMGIYNKDIVLNTTKLIPLTTGIKFLQKITQSPTPGSWSMLLQSLKHYLKEEGVSIN